LEGEANNQVVPGEAACIFHEEEEEEGEGEKEQ